MPYKINEKGWTRRNNDHTNRMLKYLSEQKKKQKNKKTFFITDFFASLAIPKG